MSDITKFKVGNDTYNIKDEESRNTMAETVLSTDTVPFISKLMSEGKYQRKKFVGCSYVWNQLLPELKADNGWRQINFTTTFSFEDGVMTLNSSSYADCHNDAFLPQSGHKYLVINSIYPTTSTIYYRLDSINVKTYEDVVQEQWVSHVFMFSASESQMKFICQAYNGTKISKYMIIDLTQLFGSTAIADAIYNLEQATAGAGVAKLKELGFFTEDYYAYDAGSIQSVDIKEYSVTGKNLFDKSAAFVGYKLLDNGNTQANQSFTASDYIGVIPGSQLYLSNVSGNQVAITCAEYDSQKRFIKYASVRGSVKVSGSITVSSNTYYIRVNMNIANSDICQVELGSTATAYEPYHKSTYPLTPTELRGVPKIDANNNIYCDGDEYASDGEHKSNYNIVDLGTLTWEKDTAEADTASTASLRNIIPNTMLNRIAAMICPKYIATSFYDYTEVNKAIAVNSVGRVYIHDSDFVGKTAEEVKTYLSGTYLVYWKITPTTETLTPFDYPQSVGSLEEIVDYKVEQEDRDVAIPTGHVTEYMGKGGEFTLPTLPETPSVLAFDGHNAYWNKNIIDEVDAAWDGINRIMLPGRDLTVIFADEIADYSDEWAWIQARLDAHDVSGLRVGDYIPINIAANGGIAAETHKAEIAGINTYRRTGDSGHKVGYHIDWITRDCYSGTVKFNTTNINNGNASNSSPFLASNLKSWLDGTLYPLLDAKLKAVIKAKRILAPYRYQSGETLTDDNSWDWQDFDKLWAPLEGEIFDSLVWSTKGYGNGQAVQYPIFANSYEHRMKGAGPGGARANWWTASAYSGYSTYVAHVSGYGNSSHTNASNAFCVPVCFRTMEA